MSEEKNKCSFPLTDLQNVGLFGRLVEPSLNENVRRRQENSDRRHDGEDGKEDETQSVDDERRKLPFVALVLTPVVQSHLLCHEAKFRQNVGQQRHALRRRRRLHLSVPAAGVVEMGARGGDDDRVGGVETSVVRATVGGEKPTTSLWRGRRSSTVTFQTAARRRRYRRQRFFVETDFAHAHRRSGSIVI